MAIREGFIREFSSLDYWPAMCFFYHAFNSAGLNSCIPNFLWPVKKNGLSLAHLEGINIAP